MRGGIGCYGKCVPGRAEMVTTGVLLALSYKSITCFKRALHMKGARVVLADKGYYGFG